MGTVGRAVVFGVGPLLAASETVSMAGTKVSRCRTRLEIDADGVSIPAPLCNDGVGVLVW